MPHVALKRGVAGGAKSAGLSIAVDHFNADQRTMQKRREGLMREMLKDVQASKPAPASPAKKKQRTYKLPSRGDRTLG